MSMKDCKVPEGILVYDFEKDDGHDSNYCYAQPTTAAVSFYWGAWIVGVGGTALMLMAASGAAAGGLEVVSEVVSKWPHAGG